jgi:hypothetical protein
MKNIRTILLLSALGVASIFTACDNMEDDVPPTNSSNIIVNNDRFTTTKNQGVLFNILTNDSIGSNAAITFTQPVNGTVQAGNSQGIIYYQPRNNFMGIDSFSYQACIGGDCAIAKVFVEVKDSLATSGCTLMARPDTASLNKNQTLTFNILQNDQQCLGTTNSGTATIIQQPAHGQAGINPNGQLVYTPANNFTGLDYIQYKLSGANGTSTTFVALQVFGQGPCTLVANMDQVNLIHNMSWDSVSVKVMANDTWCQNGTAPVVNLSYTQTLYGNLIKIGTGPQTRIIYSTQANVHNVTDRFTYFLCQGNTCDSASVKVHIQ